jgi:N-acetyl-anhydromuramyl-L-alanine amidase AmpD
MGEAPVPRKTMTRILTTTVFVALLIGCAHQKPQPVAPPQIAVAPVGDEIIVVGQRFHTGAPVVLWTDAGGYNAYTSWSGPTTRAATPHLEKVKNVRMSPLTDAEVEQVKKDGWTLPFLQKNVDQFVIHYDVCGTSRTCFKVLHDRGLGVQFMLDLDGTIYQTMDLQEEAWHATDSNGRSVGVEIANMGAYGGSIVPLMEWYAKDPATGETRISLPARFGDGGIRTPNFVGHPDRNDIVTGQIQGATYHQYDFTPQQYDSLTKLTAALCTVFPKIQCNYPKDASGHLIPHFIGKPALENYQGVLGHYHVQTDKQDPGPAFQWDRVIGGAQKLMTPQALEANKDHRGQPAKFIPSPPEKKGEKE